MNQIFDTNHSKEERFVLFMVSEDSVHGYLAQCIWAKYHGDKNIWRREMFASRWTENRE
jgi:nitrite reductase/ring-hydroxylating ferredoxin subunit